MDEDDGKRLNLMERLVAFIGSSSHWTQIGVLVLLVISIMWLVSLFGVEMPPAAAGEYGTHDREYKRAQETEAAKGK